MSSAKPTPDNAVRGNVETLLRERGPQPADTGDALRTDLRNAKRLRWRQLLARLRDRQTAGDAGSGSRERRRSRAIGH